MIGSKRIREIIQQMSLREKAAEMSQLRGENPDGTLMGIAHGIHKDPFLDANAGSLLGFSGAKRTMQAQHDHMEKNRHKIPLLFMTDVIHGYKTAFPSVLGLGAAWDPELAGDAASASAAEAAVSGIHVTFSPMADLVRDARWGRVTESTGEDPFLNSLYTAAFVRGYQGDGIDRPLKIASCVKHFIGYGASEGGRDYDSTQIGEYQLYNDYLPPFQAAIDAGCEMLMPGFNAFNGIPCTANKQLLTGLLRNELSFTGAVISDCTAVWELICHGVCQDEKDAARSSIEAGIDIEMVSSSFYENMEALLSEGKITEAQIDAAVERILTLKDRLGLFENPHKDADPEKEKQLHLCPAHRALARRAAAASAVLLKNEESALPLRDSEKIALIGPLADSRHLIDVWGLINGEEKDCVTVLEGLNACSFKAPVSYRKGCRLKHTGRPDEIFPDDAKLLSDALSAAADCDKIVLVLGEHPEMSAESGSRADITLPDNQMKLLTDLSALKKPVITVVLSGRPLALADAARLSDALLLAWFPGTEGGNGIADVLTGRYAPTGRLPMSVPRSSGQCPVYYNHLPTGRPNTSGKYNRFKNGYIDLDPGPLYPFGYGLSYTDFSISAPALTKLKPPASENGGPLLYASVRVKNTGSREGTQTVQLYVNDVSASCSRPVKMLRGFKKVTLAPGEEAEVSFAVSAAMLSFYVPGRGVCLEPGLFRVFIGPDAGTEAYISFTLLPDGDVSF